MRSCDDIDEQALSYAEIKALCAGDPRIREKMDLDVQVAKLKVLRGDFQNQKYRLEDKLLKTFPEEIQKQKTRIAALQQDSQIAAAHPQDKENFCGMTIKGMVYDDKKAAGERLLLARQEMPNHRIKSVPPGRAACIEKCRTTGFGALPQPFPVRWSLWQVIWAVVMFP